MAALVCSPAPPTLTSQVTIYGWSTSQGGDRQLGSQLKGRGADLRGVESAQRVVCGV